MNQCEVDEGFNVRYHKSDSTGDLPCDSISIMLNDKDPFGTNRMYSTGYRSYDFIDPIYLRFSITICTEFGVEIGTIRQNQDPVMCLPWYT